MISDKKQPEAIAIVGMTGRFPGAKDLDAFWRNLRDGVESVTFFSDEELIADGIDPELLRDPNYVRAKGFLEDAELFDASFFGVNPREAELIDPQQRIFLQAAYNALESAGCDPERYDGAIGVYAGLAMNTYVMTNLATNPELMQHVGFYQGMLANDKDFLATRVSYKLNLRGPSLTLQTACSTSLVAVQMACQSLLTHQCDMALAGGVCVYSPRRNGYLYQQGMILSPDGHCRAFDAAAQGIVSGEGVGIVVLKRLSEALADGDTIRAIIRGAAINNDGSVKVGYTAPSVGGQAEVIAMAQAMGGVDPDTIDYVECHGTGTPLGDPIEVGALTQVFRAATERRQFCAIGSVKTNIGHLDAAAGVAGLIKTVLAMEHRQIPPNVHFREPNPQIDFANSPFYVSASLKEWPASERRPRRAGVSSFGIGGTNAHVVIEECGVRSVESGDDKPKPRLIVLSAKTSSALEAQTKRLAEYFEANPELSLADAAWTLQVGRQSFAQRRMVVANDAADAAAALLDPRRAMRGEDAAAERQSLAFMFTGQGSQYAGMARGLYEAEPAFRRTVDRCADMLFPSLGLDLRDLVFTQSSAPSPTQDSELRTQDLNQTRFAQPALFTIEYAIAMLLQEWGIKPQAMIGHSIGEYAAACVAGVFSLQDALAIVAERGRLMQSMPQGAMMTVPLPEGETRPLLPDEISVAAINAPGMTVVSGPNEAIEELAKKLESRGLSCRRLHTSHAYHSAMMEPILKPFEQFLGRFTLNAPSIRFVSNVSGDWIKPEEATSPAYWARHLRGTVRFAAGLRTLAAECGAFIETGPGQTLCMIARQQEFESRPLIVPTLPHANENEPDMQRLLGAVGRLWLAGAQIEWRALAGGGRRRIPLPEYPFDGQRFWVEPGKAAAAPQEAALTKRANVADWFYTPSWKRTAPARCLARVESECVLVFSPEQSIGLGERLAGDGRRVFTVEIGKRFDQPGPDRFTINPGSADDYTALLRAIDSAGAFPDQVVHAWNVIDGSALNCDAAQQRGFYSLINLLQASQQVWPRREWQLDVVTNGLQEVSGEAVRNPERATIYGVLLVAPFEMPFISVRSVDLPWEASPAIDALMEELSSAAKNDQIALRGDSRWVRAYEPAPLAEARARVKERGVYLITGGLGDIGLALARHLAQTARARLVLVGRSPLPPREEWPVIVSGDGHDGKTRDRVRAVMELEEAGAEALVCAADVADAEQIREAVAAARARFGRIDGVIHTAGVLGGGIIALRTPEQSSRMISPKLQGTLNLDAALRDENLDFFVMTSSIDAVVGWFGQADYSAANAFMDAFAASRPGRNFISINWDTWRDIGMATASQVSGRLQAVKDWNLSHGIATAEGIEAFDRILAFGLPQVVVSTIDLDARRAKSLEVKLDEQPAQQSEAAAEKTSQTRVWQAAHERPNLPNAYVEPRNDIERAMAQIWAGLLGIDPVGAFDNFFDLGGHSLLAVQVISRIQKQFEVEIPLRTLFESPTVAGLAEHVETLRWSSQGRQAVQAGAGREEFEL